MANRIKAGATSVSIQVKIDDSTSHNGKTGLVYNTSGLTAYYARPGAAPVAITLATQTVGGAWASGGFVEKGATAAAGLYRIDVPDAAFATGVDSVVVGLRGTGMDDCDLQVDLVADDPRVSAYQYQGKIGSGSTTTSIVLDSTASATDGAYVNGVLLVAGLGARIITTYTGATKTATVAAYGSAPTAGTAATVLPQDIAAMDASAVATAVWDALESGHTVAGSFGALLTLVRRILKNRRETNPATGVQTIYADDGTTPLITGNIWNDVAGATAYNGTNSINRADALA